MADTSQVKQTNRRLIMAFVKEHGPVSKKAIQTELGLSWGTVSTLSNELYQEGYIAEAGRQKKNGTGQDPVLWDIDEHKHLVVGVDFNVKGADAVVVDLKGRSLYKSKVLFTNKKKDEVLSVLYEMLDDIFDIYDKDAVRSLSFSMQGMIDHEKGVSLYLEAIQDWVNVPIKEFIEQRYQIKTHLMRDTNCVVISEKNLKMGQMRLVNNAILLRLDTYGIGMGLLFNGECYLGGNGRAGEIGQMLVQTDHSSDKTFLQEYVCERGLVQQYCALTGKSVKGVTLPMIAQRARQHEESACKVFEEISHHLGSALVNLANIYDPETIVLFGNMRKYGDLLLERLQEYMDRYFYGNMYQQHIKIQLSELEANAGAKGAALFAINEEISAL